ncbi:conserved Plasmodium protein, unknown function [Plasmodium ovale]|uniref:Uncharacterized protein n=1 Tax=Plasmodium ovale TaxID=36330 RepID=A0A1C3KTS7_PLAOA|nr:conserved Plasmodium protein, unknown function [Plasmodium ovale]
MEILHVIPVCSQMDGHNTINLDKVGELFTNTVGLMKSAVHGLAQRNSTIYNMLYMSDNMQNKGDYQELSNDVVFNKNQIIKLAVVVVLLYALFTAFSYIFMNYIMFYFIIIVLIALGVRYFIYQYNSTTDEAPLLQNNYYNFEAHSI